MLTLFGYVPPTALFVLGVMGLLSGYIPYLTRRPAAGWQIRVVSALLLIPLPVAVWLGLRQPPSAEPLGELAAAQQLQAERLREAEALAAEAGGQEVADRVAKARQTLETRAVPAREELGRITAGLQEYHRFFDRLFVSLLALLIAIAVVPATKPFPRERAAPKRD